MIDTVYLSQKEKDQLLKIKRATGIQNWNILCRWALCLSLNDKTQPPAIESAGDHAIEMTWKVFGGQDHEIFISLLKKRLIKDEIPLCKEKMTHQLRAHLNRGINWLTNKDSAGNIYKMIKIMNEKHVESKK